MSESKIGGGDPGTSEITQMLLPLSTSNNETYEAVDFFVSTCNAEAYNSVGSSPAKWPNGRMILIGEKGGGKTHLSKIWLKTNNAVSVDTYLENMMFPMTPCHTHYLLEDIDRLDFDEKALLTFIDLATIADKRLLITARNIDKFRLNDLRSRLESTYTTRIHNPDYETVYTLVHKYIHNKRLRITQNSLEYLCSRLIEKGTYDAIEKTADNINSAISKSSQRQLNIIFLKKILME